MSKDLNRRIEKLEKKIQGVSESILFIMDYVDGDGVSKEPTGYSCGHNGLEVIRQPGETCENFKKRAIAELYGDSLENPGIYFMHALNK